MNIQPDIHAQYLHGILDQLRIKQIGGKNDG